MIEETTVVLDEAESASYAYNPASETLTFDTVNLWRIALTITSVQARLIVDVRQPVLIGRSSPQNAFTPTIDLAPFGAQESGVSRLHLMLAIENSRLVAIDHYSVNGTRLNGMRMFPEQTYPLHDGDQLVLGRLQVEVNLLHYLVYYVGSL